MFHNLKLLLIIESLESQIKEFTEKINLIRISLRSKHCSSSKLPSNEYSVKKKPHPKSRYKKDGKRFGNQEGSRGESFDMVNDYDWPK
jgi:hypothetical protein